MPGKIIIIDGTRHRGWRATIPAFRVQASNFAVRNYEKSGVLLYGKIVCQSPALYTSKSVRFGRSAAEENSDHIVVGYENRKEEENNESREMNKIFDARGNYLPAENQLR